MSAGRERPIRNGLTPGQRTALLARLSKPSVRAPEIAVANGDSGGDAPLSFAQQRLWFLDRLQGPDPTYNIPLGIRINGPLDRVALDAAFASLIVRHDVLRMRITEGPEGPRLNALSSDLSDAVVGLRHMDVSGKNREQGLAEAEAFSVTDAQQPFNLLLAPLFRATLIALGDEEHHLYLTLHHIISDGWSNGILLRDLLAFYLEARDGVSIALPALPVGYLDFVRWQRDPARAALIEQQTVAWQRRLDGVPHGLQIATDFQRPAALSYRGGLEAFAVGQRRMVLLRDACQTRGASLFMGLLAIFGAVLGRHGGGTDLVIGSPIANRPRPEFEQLAGFFANTIALRVDLGGDPSFADLLTRMRQLMLDAYRDQEAPFEQLVERLGAARGLDRTPLFEAMLVFQQASVPTMPREQLGLSLEPLERMTGRIHFPLTLGITEKPDGLEVHLGYHTDLFAPATAARLARHFEILLDLVARQPDVPLSRLALLGVDEVAELDRLAGAPAAQHRTQLDLRGLVEDQARRSAAVNAVEAVDGTLTYADLMTRSNRLARHLCELNVRTGRPIGLCADRRLAMPIAVLASLKAGCPVLMLDPALPPQRLAALIEDSKPALILAHRRWQSVLPASASVVFLDDIEELTKDLPDAPPERPLDLAYVLYTSGSTGRPKGVAMGAGAFANLVEWQRGHPVLGRKQRTAQFAALGFDVAFQEMFGAWVTGGTLVLVDQQTRQDPRALWSFLAEERIERLYLPMVALQTLAEAALREPDRQQLLQDVIVAGEALEVTPAVRRFFALLKRGRLHNHYGPTETHVVTTESLDGAPADWPSRPYIGHPVPGVVVRVVGLNGERAPLGVAGELWIGGVQLADGYLGQPDLTDERFVTDAASMRFYRTGDRVRQWPDGRLEFMGRIDDQVKIRGFRVEPGEVVAALRSHAAVADAAVVAFKGPDGGQALSAYVVAADGEADVAARLREYLLGKLPVFCVPSSIILLEHLPLTPNGKIDRRRLPEPDMAASAGNDRFVAPQTPTEQRLAEIWASVFGLDKISATSDFFDMGGHSLLAVRLALRISESLGTDLPLRFIFEVPALRDMAARIDGLRAASVSRPPLVPVDRSGPLPLSFAQERLYFLDQFHSNASAYNMPAAIRLAGILDVAALERAFSTLVRRHEILRTRFVSNQGRPVQIVDPPYLVEVPVVDLAALDEVSRGREIDQEVARFLAIGFNLATGPLMHLRLLRLGTRDVILMIAFHHIVMDEWSIGILLRELEAVYSGGGEQSLPQVKAQHGDYAMWQRSWLDQAATGPQATYWQKQLAGAPFSTRLPFDRARPGRRSGRGGGVPLKVPRPVAEGLMTLAQQQRATTFMALLGALTAFLFRVSGERDIVVGTPIANRVVPEIENSIGFFVNMVALRMALDEAASFSALLRQARDVSLGAFANQDLPFERVVELANPVRSGETTPFVNVVLAFRENGGGGLTLPGLTAAPWPLGAASVKYDLIFTLVVQEDGFVGAIEFDADLFDRHSIELLADGFAALLSEVVASPQTPVLDLQIGSRRQAVHPKPDFDF